MTSRFLFLLEEDLLLLEEEDLLLLPEEEDLDLLLLVLFWKEIFTCQKNVWMLCGVGGCRSTGSTAHSFFKCAVKGF